MPSCATLCISGQVSEMCRHRGPGDRPAVSEHCVVVVLRGRICIFLLVLLMLAARLLTVYARSHGKSPGNLQSSTITRNLCDEDNPAAVSVN